MAFLVIFWLGLGNPRHIATKSQQIKFWSILKKVGIGSDSPPQPPLGPNSKFLPKICSWGFPYLYVILMIYFTCTAYNLIVGAIFYLHIIRNIWPAINF